MTKLRTSIVLLIALAAFGLGVRPAFSQGAETMEDRLNGLSDSLQLLVDRYDAPGLAVAVVADGQIVYAEGFGHENVEEGRPVTDRSLFGIGSVVKTFTSALTGALIGDGAIDLEGRPGDYVTGLSFGAEDLERNLRISHLLSHTSGLADMAGSTVVFPETTQVLLAPRFAHFEAACRVGDCWTYNNINFMLLDMVAEAVTGQSKITLFAERLLEPAGMAHSVSSTEAFLASPHAVRGYGLVGEDLVPVAYENLFGEHVYATAPDLARWLMMWMHGGLAGERQVVPQAYARQALSMQAIENGAPPSPDAPNDYLYGYGYGWNVKSMDGHYTVSHGGNENGFSAHVLGVPAEAVGVVALTNQQGSILPNLVTDYVIHLLLDLPATDLMSYPVVVGQVDAVLSAEEARLSPVPNDPMTIAPFDLVGRYSAAGYGTVEVAFADDRLTLVTPLAHFALRHLGGNRFGLGITAPLPAGMNASYFVAAFNEEEGEATSMSINLASEPVRFDRVEPR
ncbi:MAG: serine hydrolase domain-containing protein [Bacteroidota bacterium]